MLSSISLMIFSGRLPKTLVAFMGAGSVALSALLTLLFAVNFLNNPEPVQLTLWTWIEVGSFNPGVAFYLDAELQVMTLNYRDEKNNPLYEAPKVLQKPEWNLEGKRILLVDDVSVSGKTMNVALEQLKGLDVKTLAMKGRADFVLFPEIKDCVKWPWKV